MAARADSVRLVLALPIKFERQPDHSGAWKPIHTADMAATANGRNRDLQDGLNAARCGRGEGLAEIELAGLMKKGLQAAMLWV